MPAESRRPGPHCHQCLTRSVCLLNRLPEAVRETLMPHVQERQLPRGTYLFHEGEVLQRLQVVKLGTVYRSRLGQDGERRPVGLAGRGSVFGSLGYFGHRSQTSVQAMGAVRLCELALGLLREQAAQHPALDPLLLAELTHAVGAVATWSEGMRLRGVTNQLAYALLLMAEHEGSATVELPTQQALADLLGASRETVVRTLALLQAEGLMLRLDPRRYRLCLEGLRSKVAGPVAAPEAPR